MTYGFKSDAGSEQGDQEDIAGRAVVNLTVAYRLFASSLARSCAASIAQEVRRHAGIRAQLLPAFPHQNLILDSVQDESLPLMEGGGGSAGNAGTN